jgi:spore germination protein YaaH
MMLIAAFAIVAFAAIALFASAHYVVRSSHVPAVPPTASTPTQGSLLSTGAALMTQLIPKASPPVPAKVMAWLFPSKVICSSAAEYSDGRKIDFLKPEYFTVSDSGSLTLLTAASKGCNGFSAANAASVKAHSTYQFVTVSSALGGMQALTATPASRSAASIKLTEFAIENGFTGIEIDFEDFGSWDAATYQNYLAFINELGGSLHASGKQLMVDVPPIGTPVEQGYYPLTYQDIAATPTDYIVVMAYDNQYDQGVGAPIAPNAWVESIITWSKKYIPMNRLVIGIPNYAYSGRAGSYTPARTTYSDIKTLPGFSTALRDTSSTERTFTYGGKKYFYVDSASLDAKRTLIESYGIRYISVWALGGNPWF